MSLQRIFNPMVRAYFKNRSGGSGGGADELAYALATNGKYELKSDAVISVSASAFYGDETLTSVDFPNAKAVNNSAFYGCKSLVGVNLPNVVTIEDSAFESSSIKEANFPMVTIMDSRAFSFSGIMNANFPMVKVVQPQAFSNCKSLTKVNFPLAETIRSYAFATCENLKSVTCPSVTHIESHAFNGSGCEKLDFHTVTNISEGAFAGCSSLTAVIVRTTSRVCLVDFSALNGTPAMSGQGHVYVPASMFEAYRETYEPGAGATMFNAIFRKIEDYPEICG